jgi:hypothetical protein
MVSASLKLSPTSGAVKGRSVLGPLVAEELGGCGRGVSCDTRVCIGYNPLWCTAISMSPGGCGTAACISDGRPHSHCTNAQEKRTYSLVAKDCVVENLTKPDPLQPLHRSAVVTTRIWCALHCTVSVVVQCGLQMRRLHSSMCRTPALRMRQLGTAQVLQYQAFTASRSVHVKSTIFPYSPVHVQTFVCG